MVVLPIKAIRPLLLHLQAMGCFGLALLDAQLFKEDIGTIEDVGLGAGVGPFHVAESSYLRALNLRGLVDVQLGKHVAAELGLSHSWSLKVDVDLTPNLVTCVIDRDGVGLLSFKVDIADIDRSVGSRHCSRTTATGSSGSRGGATAIGSSTILSCSGGRLLGTLDRKFEAGNLALLELPGTIKGGIVKTLVRPTLAHEAVQRLDADSNLLSEGRLRHSAAIEKAGDLASDLITVLRSGHVLDVDIVKIDSWLLWKSGISRLALLAGSYWLGFPGRGGSNDGSIFLV